MCTVISLWRKRRNAGIGIFLSPAPPLPLSSAFSSKLSTNLPAKPSSHTESVFFLDPLLSGSFCLISFFLSFCKKVVDSHFSLCYYNTRAKHKTCRCGGIGIRAWFRFMWALRSCGFKSRHLHDKPDNQRVIWFFCILRNSFTRIGHNFIKKIAYHNPEEFPLSFYEPNML